MLKTGLRADRIVQADFSSGAPKASPETLDSLEDVRQRVHGLGKRATEIAGQHGTLCDQEGEDGIVRKLSKPFPVGDSGFDLSFFVMTDYDRHIAVKALIKSSQSGRKPGGGEKASTLRVPIDNAKFHERAFSDVGDLARDGSPEEIAAHLDRCLDFADSVLGITGVEKPGISEILMTTHIEKKRQPLMPVEEIIQPRRARQAHLSHAFEQGYDVPAY